MADQSLELQQDGMRITASVFGMSFFIGGSMADYAGELTAVQDGWTNFVGKSRLGWYATETMSKHRKTNAKTFSMLEGWTAPASPKRDYIALMLKDGAAYNETGATIFEVFANPTYDPGRDLPAYLHLALPAAEAEEKLADLEKVFLSICGKLPICSAQAGWGIETTPYFPDVGVASAWAQSLRHPGLDVFTGHSDRRAAGLDGLRSVNWLTAISAKLANDAGGTGAIRAALPDEVAMLPLSGGAVALRAGSVPAIGDVNRGDRLPLYAAVDTALRPLVERCASRMMWFKVDGDREAATLRWLNRFVETG